MATTALTVKSVAITGLNVDTNASAAASGDGNVFNNAGNKVMFFVRNGGGAPINVTIATKDTEDGLTIADRVVAVPAGEEMIIGPFSGIYEDYDADNAIDEAVTVTYSATASVEVMAFKI